MHNCFYTGSLNHRATSSLPRQLEPGFHYIQNFYKSNTKITLLNNKTHKIFDSHTNLDTHPTRITLADLKKHQANHPEQKNIQTWWWLSLANPTCVLQATHKPKCLQDQSRSSKHELQLCIVERELSRDEWQNSMLKNSYLHLCSRKHNLYSLV